jgi:hypothetical protein
LASDYHDGRNCNQLGLYINWHIVGLIAISSDHISIGIDGGFEGGFDGGFDSGSFGQFHLAVLGYRPQQSVGHFSPEALVAI